MGCCQSTADSQNQADEERSRGPHALKVLFLGTSNSGKTTWFKQVLLTHGEGFDDAYRRTSKYQIFYQLITTLKSMIEIGMDPKQHTQHCQEAIEKEMKLDDELIESLAFDLENDANLADSIEFIEELSNSTELNNVEQTNLILASFQTLWSNETTQKIFELRSKFCIPDFTGLSLFLFFFLLKYSSLIPLRKDIEKSICLQTNRQKQNETEQRIYTNTNNRFVYE